MKDDELTGLIIGKAIEIHRHFGPGLLESAYQTCLEYELNNLGLFVEKEKKLPIIYKEIQLNHGYRIDLLIENRVVIELKTVEYLNEKHDAQLLTYMKLGGFKLGLILNFNEKLLKDGIRRFVF